MMAEIQAQVVRIHERILDPRWRTYVLTIEVSDTGDISQKRSVDGEEDGVAVSVEGEQRSSPLIHTFIGRALPLPPFPVRVIDYRCRDVCLRGQFA